MCFLCLTQFEENESPSEGTVIVLSTLFDSREVQSNETRRVNVTFGPDDYMSSEVFSLINQEHSHELIIIIC